MSKKCTVCFNGFVLDDNYENFNEIDEKIDKYFDGGQFSYHDAFQYVTSKDPQSKKKCKKCNGSGFID